MASVRAGGEFNTCVHMCGVCPYCIFAPEPPGSTRRRWDVSDDFRRTFLVGLLSRCTNIHELESIGRMLSATSWTWVSYSRSRSPATAPQGPARGSCRAPRGKPLGVNLNEIWTWFSNSPDWMKSGYLYRVLSLCDVELLRMLSNLTSVLLVRQKRGFMQFNVTNRDPRQQNEEPEDPAFMVVPGSSKSISGVSKYRDFIRCLPVNLSKMILGLLDENTLRCCKSVGQYWQHLSEETLEEIKFRGIFNNQIKVMMECCRSNKTVNPSFANFVGVPVPVNDEEQEVIHSVFQKVMPFEAVYAKIKTKTVQMEERNVYCGAYFTEELLNQEDKHRVLDYKGGFLMAMSSKNLWVQLLHVASETKTVAVMKGHVGPVRAVLLCPDRDLLITAGCDATIRCWNMKTDRCDLVLNGHSGAINCLDVHTDRLVSGGKDCRVRVWSLHTGKRFQDLNFKHYSSVQCVKINRTTIYSSCGRGRVKIWNMESASLLKVIYAHKSSVKCLFFDEWHLLSGDSEGKVMAWSVSCEAAGCLMTFNHPKGVKSLTLTYLRVITGCSDGKIRIFNFVTGDCLRDITLGSESGPLLSLHFQEHSILVNTASSVQLYQFAKVSWDYTNPAQAGAGDVVPQDGSVSEGSAGFVRRFPRNSTERCGMTSQSPKSLYPNRGKPELLQKRCFLATPSKSQRKTRVCSDARKQSVIQSERAACERMRKRGPHHPPTGDAMLLRMGASQRALCADEVSLNMENNARLRDSWGPSTLSDPKQNLQSRLCPQQPSHDGDRRAKSCLPTLKRAVSQNMTYKPRRREVSTAPNSPKRHHSPHTTQPDRGKTLIA
ncbi:F-box and WD repeat domain containing protein 10B [Fundulus diaphanus]